MRAALIAILMVAGIGCAATAWSGLSIPLIAAALALISRQRRGNDGIPEFYSLLAGVIVFSCLLTGLLLIGKRLFGIT